MAEQMQKMELKEKYDRTRFVRLMREWADAMERNQAFDVQVNGENHRIPGDAVERGYLRVEYEIEDGEYELELTMKWR